MFTFSLFYAICKALGLGFSFANSICRVEKGDTNLSVIGQKFDESFQNIYVKGFAVAFTDHFHYFFVGSDETKN